MLGDGARTAPVNIQANHFRFSPSPASNVFSIKTKFSAVVLKATCFIYFCGPTNDEMMSIDDNCFPEFTQGHFRPTLICWAINSKLNGCTMHAVKTIWHQKTIKKHYLRFQYSLLRNQITFSLAMCIRKHVILLTGIEHWYFTFNSHNNHRELINVHWSIIRMCEKSEVYFTGNWNAVLEVHPLGFCTKRISKTEGNARHCGKCIRFH